ncbi:MAG: GFA family protein [Candidatus Marinimicrobia bacterium]|jgi:hypothetical protein|nr:GFA family protein [Candidatus Neomarinimicrobiota bacterium]
MSEDGKKSGGCLCGGVRFHIDSEIAKFTACHCEMCRRWASGPYLATNCGENVSFEDEENLGRFKSSDWAERGFCKICGSSLFYFLAPAGQYLMSVGAFDDQNGLEMKNQVFIDHKPDCYAFTNQTKLMTADEVMALITSKD